MPLDPQIANLLELFAADPSVKPVQHCTPAEVRTRIAQTSRTLAGKPEPIGAATDSTIPGHTGPIPIRVYTPYDATGEPLPCVIFFHGGGWVGGDLDSHDALCRLLCNASRARLVAVDYRLAPEHPFPAAVEDALHATHWIAQHANRLGIDPMRIAVAGDSAGGNLAAIVAHNARDTGRMLKLQLLIYPVTDTRTDTASYADNAEGYALERTGMEWFFEQYLPDPTQRTHPHVAVLHAPDLRRLAPALILTAGYDPLRDDGRAYATALRQAGNHVTLQEHDTLIHGFAVMLGVSDVSRRAVLEAGRLTGEALRA
jgi:acetyl esterase